jgi:hypothetical protein
VSEKRPAKLSKFKRADDSMASPVSAGLPKFGEIHADQRSTRCRLSVIDLVLRDSPICSGLASEAPLRPLAETSETPGNLHRQ